MWEAFIYGALGGIIASVTILIIKHFFGDNQ